MENKTQKAKLINYGSLAAFDEDKVPSSQSISGFLLHSDSIEFIDQSDVLQGKVGTAFGIEYYIEGLDPEARKEDAHFTCVITHPLMINPLTGESATEVKEEKYDYLNENNYDYFRFEHDWEMVTGKWIFRILQEGNSLLEKAFEIV